MKSTDVVQPIPMQTPIAVSGSRDTIPQNQADTQEPFFCSIENGFPDITMKALNEGGRPPRGQGANGLFYLSTDQRVFLQNGGLITFNNTVSNLIGGYPQGAVLAYKQGGLIQWLESTIDDNTYNFNENSTYIGTYWHPLIPQLLDSSGVPDVIIIGSPTIQNGQVSNFTVSDYIQYPLIFDPQSYNWEINLCFTAGADVNTQQNLLDSAYGIAFAVINEKFVISLSSNGSSWDIAQGQTGSASVTANTTYYTKLAYDGADYKLSYSTDNSTFTDDITVSSSAVINPANLLFSGTGHPFGGSLNLNNCNIWINGAEVWTGIDDIGLATKANIDLSNLSAAGEARFKKAEYPIGAPIPQMSANMGLADNEIYLEGATVAQAAYPELYAVYGSTYSTSSVISAGNFTLPDLRDKVLWGASGTSSALYKTVQGLLPGLKGTIASLTGDGNASQFVANGVFSVNNLRYLNNVSITGAGLANNLVQLGFDASSYSGVYSSTSTSTVRPTSLYVRWKTRYA